MTKLTKDSTIQELLDLLDEETKISKDLMKKGDSNYLFFKKRLKGLLSFKSEIYCTVSNSHLLGFDRT